MNRFSVSLLATITVATSLMPRGACAEPPSVLVRTIDDEAIAGAVTRMSLDDGLMVEDTRRRVRRIPARHLVTVSTHRSAVTPSSGAVSVEMLDGSRLVGTPGVFADDAVTLTTLPFGNIAVPLEKVSVWMNPKAADHRDAVDEFLSQSSVDEDRLLLTNGDRAAGVILEIDHRAVTLETQTGPVRIGQERIVAADIVTGTPARDSGLLADVRFIDGSRIVTNRLEWSDGQLRLGLFANLETALERSIQQINLIGGRWRWLAEIEPIQARQTPIMEIDWPHRINRNVIGRPLTVAGTTFERGVGVHGGSSLTYRLDGSYVEFVTSYGVDDESGPLADVAVEIRVDGQSRHRRTSVRQGELYGPVRIDVSQAKRLELLADFGRLGGIQDRVDWIEPALILENRP